ncbi:zinc finger, CCHC-type containing protein [Tanacetum coccineum]
MRIKEDIFRGKGQGKPRFSQGRNHENFKEERKEENSHRSYNRNNFKKSNYDTSKLRCYECKKLGHIAPKCPFRTNTNEQSNLVEEDLEPTLLMATLEVEEQEVSLHEKDVGYKETNMDSLCVNVGVEGCGGSGVRSGWGGGREAVGEMGRKGCGEGEEKRMYFVSKGGEEGLLRVMWEEGGGEGGLGLGRMLRLSK